MNAPLERDAHLGYERPKRQLIWVLISILLFLFFLTTYCFWAKLESAWPITR